MSGPENDRGQTHDRIYTGRLIAVFRGVWIRGAGAIRACMFTESAFTEPAQAIIGKAEIEAVGDLADDGEFGPSNHPSAADNL